MMESSMAAPKMSKGDVRDLMKPLFITPWSICFCSGSDISSVSSRVLGGGLVLEDEGLVECRRFMSVEVG